MSSSTEAAGIFILPNGTFIVEVIIFGLVLLIMWRVILPPIQKALGERQDMLDRQVEESREASEKAVAAQERYHAALAEARTESGRIRDEARAEGQATLDEMRGVAHTEANAVLQRGTEQLAAQRATASRELQGQIGGLGVALAGRVLGTDLTGQASAATVSRLLGELEVDV
ncbi:MAG TPA: F0F1 ATP synthase subunit B [Pseudonocardiaceae bacterium]|jgi:F-type H+-transporting ATPase subunit b|nr:F0F1 ATP synthase subunit B [Pseudonocardiaceae bacterium]